MKKLVLIIVSIIFFCIACKDKNPNKPFLVSIIGRSGEIIIVADNSIWTSIAGDTLRNCLAASYPALPQDEPLFDIIHMTSSNFADLYKSHRNLLFIETGAEYNQPQVEFSKNVWAKPQMVITIKAKNQEGIIQAIQEKGDKIISVLEDTERKRQMAIHHDNKENKIMEKIKLNHGINLDIPFGYNLDINQPNFNWISLESEHAMIGLLIKTMPVDTTLRFEKNALLNLRDSILNKHVPGRVDGSYMTTERKAEIYYNNYSYKGRNLIELRGLWKMKNGDFMGGPFISILTKGGKPNTMVYIEGYVFAPAKDKRNYIRQLEAIMYSIK